MSRSDLDRIDDILAAIADIRADTAGMDYESFSCHPAHVRAVLYSIGVIGEAAKNIGSDVKAGLPSIPWRAISGIRDRIVHEYFRTNTRRIWEVITDDLDPLEQALKSARGIDPA
jgi:uncharacterized protein with HEPN domain